MKNTTKFKAIWKIAGITALIAIIGFSMIACGNDDDGGDSASCSHTWATTAVGYNATETADGEWAFPCTKCDATRNRQVYPAWNKFYGTWENELATIEFSATRFRRTYSDGSSFELAAGFTVTSRSNSLGSATAKETYPTGIRISGTITNAVNMPTSSQNGDSSVNELFLKVGDPNTLSDAGMDNVALGFIYTKK